MSTVTEPARPEPSVPRNRLRATEWCRKQGINIQTFHRWRMRPDGPPAYKVFGTWYVDLDEMEAWIIHRSGRPALSVPAPAPLSASRRREIEAADREARELMRVR